MTGTGKQMLKEKADINGTLEAGIQVLVKSKPVAIDS